MSHDPGRAADPSSSSQASSSPARSPTERPHYLRPYQEMVDKIGPRFESLLWTSERTQEARFIALDDMIDLTGRVILDAGCGRADLALWLNQHQVHYGLYQGVDAVPQLLDHARSQGIPESEFIETDFVADDRAFLRGSRPPEIIIFSGSLNTLGRENALRVLSRAWRDCTEALFFNFLSDRDGRHSLGADTGPATRFPTLTLIDWALCRTPLVQFRQDYLRGIDASIVMKKDGKS